MEPMKAAELQMTLRDLWVRHILGVRSVVFATFYGDTDAAKIDEENVVNNAEEISSAEGSFYGKEEGDKLFGLLAGHYGAIKEYLMKSIAGDKARMDAAVEKLKKKRHGDRGIPSRGKPEELSEGH